MQLSLFKNLVTDTEKVAESTGLLSLACKLISWLYMLTQVEMLVLGGQEGRKGNMITQAKMKDKKIFERQKAWKRERI